MISETIQDALNTQLNFELYSSYVYWSMAHYSDDAGLSGMAAWFKMQAMEEMQHADKIAGFINERNGRVLLKAIEGPQTEWASPLAAFENAYEHECTVSSRINAIVDLAIAEKDHATSGFLQWFVAEQVEEEASVLAIVDKLKLAGSHTGALLMIDKDLAARAYRAQS